MKTFVLVLISLLYIPARAQNFVFVFLNKKQPAAEISQKKLDSLTELPMANISGVINQHSLVNLEILILLTQRQQVFFRCC